MKAWFDFLPIILFFIAFKGWGIYAATAVAIISTTALIAYQYIRGHAIEPLQWFTLGAIVILGGATLVFKDEAFIKWKPTIVYAVLSAALLVSQLFCKEPLLARLLKNSAPLPPNIFLRLNMAWALFFALMAALNLWVAMTFTTETWVNFKLFGTLGLSIAFMVAQVIYLQPYLANDHQ